MLRILALLLFAWSLMAADTKSAPKKPPPAQGTTANEDRDIERKIREKLDKAKIGKDGFKVRVQGGVAYWEGKTDVVQHKGAATRMAKTAGAKAVVNNIQVSDAAKQKATQNLEQGRRAQIKRGDPRTEKE
jgi:hypothetical protein